MINLTKNLHQFNFGTFNGCEITFSRRSRKYIYSRIVGYVTLYFTISLCQGSYDDEITSRRGLHKYFRFDVRALAFLPYEEQRRERERQIEIAHKIIYKQLAILKRSDKVPCTENALGGFHHVVIWVTSPTSRIIPVDMSQYIVTVCSEDSRGCGVLLPQYGEGWAARHGDCREYFTAPSGESLTYLNLDSYAKKQSWPTQACILRSAKYKMQ